MVEKEKNWENNWERESKRQKQLRNKRGSKKRLLSLPFFYLYKLEFRSQ